MLLLALAAHLAAAPAAGEEPAQDADLKDPFSHTPAGYRGNRPRVAGPDLKDPFAPPAPGRRKVAARPRHLVADLKDPFDGTPPCAARRPAVRIAGRTVPVQRPQRVGARCRRRAFVPSAPRAANPRDLRDPFSHDPPGW